MPVQRDEPVQLIAQEQVRLFSELKKLSDTNWLRPSHYAGWNIAEVVAHLAVGAQFFHQSVGKALRGDSQPPSLPGGQRITAEAFLARQVAQQEQLAEKPRSQVLAMFDKTGSELVDVLRRVAPHNMTRPAWHPDGTWTIAMFVSMRVFDLGLHGWDIRVALDPSAVVRPQLQPFLVNLQLQFEKRLFKADLEMDGSYRFDIGSQAWTDKVTNGKLEHRPLEPAPDVTVKTDANAFLLLCTGRESLADLQGRGLLRIEGDHDRAARMISAISRPSSTPVAST